MNAQTSTESDDEEFFLRSAAREETGGNHLIEKHRTVFHAVQDSFLVTVGAVEKESMHRLQKFASVVRCRIAEAMRTDESDLKNKISASFFSRILNDQMKNERSRICNKGLRFRQIRPATIQELEFATVVMIVCV